MLTNILALFLCGAGPALKLDRALLDRETGIVQIAFTFRNPTEGVVYLDCQGTPIASAHGAALRLAFGSAPDTAAQNYPPERVGPGQTFTAARKLYAKSPGRENPGIALDPSPFTRVEAVIAWYPERTEGEGEPFLRERAESVSASAPLEKKGKAPGAPKRRKIRTYVPPPPEDQ